MLEEGQKSSPDCRGGLRFRILGFRVWGLGFRVLGFLGFWGWGLGFRGFNGRPTCSPTTSKPLSR